MISQRAVISNCMVKLVMQCCNTRDAAFLGRVLFIYFSILGFANEQIYEVFLVLGLTYWYKLVSQNTGH